MTDPKGRWKLSFVQKERRYLEFRRKESVRLVREFLTCIDELTTITVILANTLALLENVKRNVESMEKEDTMQPDNPEGESAIDRVNWAIALVRQESLINQEVLTDLRQSLTAVCPCGAYCKNETR